jgi:hypothetical protein
MAGISKIKRRIRLDFPRYGKYLVFKRFLKLVHFGEEDECWEWQGSIRDDGYGYFCWTEKHIQYAHIASYELFVGRRKGLDVCHSCDNTKCVNPYHLWLGTHTQNMQDMLRKGRRKTLYGIDNPSSKLTKEVVEKIRYLYNEKHYTQKRLGKKFSVTQANIWNIVHNKTWA